MNAMMKPVCHTQIKTRTIVARDGERLTARYKTEKQAREAAAVLERNREALLYLSKR